MTDRLREACKDYVESKSCTLWGRPFDIKKEGGADDAADWLASQMRGVLDLRNEKNERQGEVNGDRSPAVG